MLSCECVSRQWWLSLVCCIDVRWHGVCPCYKCVFVSFKKRMKLLLVQIDLVCELRLVRSTDSSRPHLIHRKQRLLSMTARARIKCFNQHELRTEQIYLGSLVHRLCDAVVPCRWLVVQRANGARFERAACASSRRHSSHAQLTKSRLSVAKGCQFVCCNDCSTKLELLDVILRVPYVDKLRRCPKRIRRRRPLSTCVARARVHNRSIIFAAHSRCL